MADKWCIGDLQIVLTHPGQELTGGVVQWNR
jgi:hypothetical protein